MYNYRAYELMSMLHATELEEFVLELDDRVTYATSYYATPFNTVFPFQRAALGSTVVTGMNGTTAELFPSTNFGIPDIVGQCYQQWHVESTVDQFKLTHQTTPRRFVLEDTTFTDGLSELIRLPESPLQFRAQDVPGSEWRVEAYTRPQHRLGDLELAASKLGGETMLELFHVGDPEGDQEPWQTFKNLWEKHSETPYRLGGVVLALIYHTHNIWNVG